MLRDPPTFSPKIDKGTWTVDVGEINGGSWSAPESRRGGARCVELKLRTKEANAIWARCGRKVNWLRRLRNGVIELPALLGQSRLNGQRDSGSSNESTFRKWNSREEPESRSCPTSFFCWHLAAWPGEGSSGLRYEHSAFPTAKTPGWLGSSKITVAAKLPRNATSALA